MNMYYDSVRQGKNGRLLSLWDGFWNWSEDDETVMIWENIPHAPPGGRRIPRDVFERLLAKRQRLRQSGIGDGFSDMKLDSTESCGMIVVEIAG